jgi:PAS domain S-box-containing protein
MIITFLWFLVSNVLIFSLSTEIENHYLIKAHVDWAFAIFLFILIFILINREYIKRNYKKAAIEAEQNLYRTIFETAHDAIYLLNDQCEFVDCNKEALEMFQCTKEQIIGKKPVDVSPNFQFGEVKSEVLSTENMSQAKNGKPQFFEWLHTNLKKDKLFFTEVSLNRLVISGDFFLLAIIRDISKRKKAENILKESEERFRTHYNHMPIPTYTWKKNDNDFILVEYNIAAEVATKGTMKGFIGKKLSTIYKDKKEIITNINTCYSKKMLIQREMQYKSNETGEEKILDVTYVFVSLTNVIVHTEDITKKRKAENALIENEKKYRRLTENSPDITYIYSVNRGALYWSSKVKDILGFDSENLLIDSLKWNNSIYPEDIPKIKSFFENIQVGKSYEIEYRIYDIHNKIHWFNDRIFNVKGENGDIILEGIISDITKQKETEHILKISKEKYKAQYDYFPIPIYTFKKQGKDLYITNVNNAAKNYPFVKAEEIIGRNVTDFVQSKEEKVLLDALNEMFKIKQDQKFEMAYKFKTTGIKRNITAVIGFVPPDSVLLSTIDVTDKRNTQQKLYHAMINAEERERSRIAKELHDGVSPILSATKLYLQSCLNTKDENIKNEIRKKIFITIDEAIQSVSDISNKLSPHILQNFGLSMAIQSFFDKIAEITNIHHSFFYNINSKLDENIEVNIYRILIELINNTVKYANAKNIIINLHEKGDVIKIFFEHNGKGFNIDEVRNKSKGMGLYNLDNRIKLLNGDFDIESDIKTGLKVNITIPLNI